jgi:hypothetical protein
MVCLLCFVDLLDTFADGAGYLAMLFRRFVSLAVLLVLQPGYVLSQECRPKLQMVAEVSEASGAVLVGAAVQVQGISAPTKFSGTTNEIGRLRIQLEAGKYTVSVGESGFKTLTQEIEVTSVGDQRFSFVLEIDPRYSGYLGPCCFQNIQLKFEPEMSELPYQLVPPPSVSLLPLIPTRAHRRNPIARFFSAIVHQLGF